MKNKNIFAIATIAVMLVSVFCISGCATSVMLRNNDGHWVYEQKYESLIKELSIDINKKEATVNIEFADDIEIISSDIYSGKYDMQYADVSYDSVTYNLTSVNGTFAATISDRYIELTANITYKKANEETDKIFSNTIRTTLHKKSNSPDPDDPTVTEDTHFEEIKAAYADAGYDVDVELEDIDPSLQSAIEIIENAYSALGYEMSFIGKNLSSPLTMEFYMLIKANDSAGANEIAETYDGVYPYAKNGRDVMLFMNFISGSANFEPFYHACGQ